MVQKGNGTCFVEDVKACGNDSFDRFSMLLVKGSR